MIITQSDKLEMIKPLLQDLYMNIKMDRLLFVWPNAKLLKMERTSSANTIMQQMYFSDKDTISLLFYYFYSHHVLYTCTIVHVLYSTLYYIPHS